MVSCLPTYLRHPPCISSHHDVHKDACAAFLCHEPSSTWRCASCSVYIVHWFSCQLRIFLPVRARIRGFADAGPAPSTWHGPHRVYTGYMVIVWSKPPLICVQQAPHVAVPTAMRYAPAPCTADMHYAGAAFAADHFCCRCRRLQVPAAAARRCAPACLAVASHAAAAAGAAALTAVAAAMCLPPACHPAVPGKCGAACQRRPRPAFPRDNAAGTCGAGAPVDAQSDCGCTRHHLAAACQAQSQREQQGRQWYTCIASGPRGCGRRRVAWQSLCRPAKRVQIVCCCDAGQRYHAGAPRAACEQCCLSELGCAMAGQRHAGRRASADKRAEPHVGCFGVSRARLCPGVHL